MSREHIWDLRSRAPLGLAGFTVPTAMAEGRFSSVRKSETDPTTAAGAKPTLFSTLLLVIGTLADRLDNFIGELPTEFPQLIGADDVYKVRCNGATIPIIRDSDEDLGEFPLIRRKLDVAMGYPIAKVAHEIPQGGASAGLDTPCRPPGAERLIQRQPLKTFVHAALPREHYEADQRVDQLGDEVDVGTRCEGALEMDEIRLGPLGEAEGGGPTVQRHLVSSASLGPVPAGLKCRISAVAPRSVPGAKPTRYSRPPAHGERYGVAGNSVFPLPCRLPLLGAGSGSQAAFSIRPVVLPWPDRGCFVRRRLGARRGR